jgi:hypothetical protein
MEALILIAESDGPTMFARIGITRALNRHVERAFNPERKDHHWGRRKLARDRYVLRKSSRVGPLLSNGSWDGHQRHAGRKPRR